MIIGTRGGCIMRVRNRFMTVTTTLAAAVALSVATLVPTATADPPGQPAAPDATKRGPLAVTSSEYRLPASIDPEIIGDRHTEIWARVYRPRTLGDTPRPVAVFLHGNHATCGYGTNPRIDVSVQYSSSGTCPANHVVVPNHDGYGYLAERLASWGYVVVSINANRGINGSPGVEGDEGLNLARGRLVLKHLQLLSEWNTTGGAPSSLGVDLRGHLDFSELGLMGHSRGGEGMRAAFNLYRDADSPWPARIPDPLTVRGIFEIGPVDGQTGRVLDAPGTKWTVLLPMCDGDVFDLQGVRPYDRMQDLFTEGPEAQKSTYAVWGANHNYYNTEWQLSDSSGCAGHDPLWTDTMGSAEQRTTGLASVLAFFRANVGDTTPEFNRNFNPEYQLPSVVSDVTRVDRGFTHSPGDAVTRVVEDFDKPTGTNTHGYPNDATGIEIVHGPVPDHDEGQTAGAIKWTAPGGFFQTNWSAPDTAVDISDYRTLDLRVSRQASELNPDGNTTFSVQLVGADGTLSEPVPLDRHASLTGPVGMIDYIGDTYPHSILQTVRVPLAEFGTDLAAGVRGVRLTFDGTATGAIYVADLRLSNRTDLPSGASTASQPTAPAVLGATGQPETGDVVAIRSAAGIAAGASDVAITVSSPTGFPVRDELVALRVGGTEVLRSAYASGDTRQLTFTVTRAEWDALQSGDPLSVGYGGTTVTTLGPLDKTALDR